MVMEWLGEAITRMVRGLLVEATRQFRDLAEAVASDQWHGSDDLREMALDDFALANRALAQLRYGWHADWYDR